MTNRQEEYLLLFATQSEKGRCIAAASEEFGVTKASASRVSARLEEVGLISRNAHGALELTEQGRALIEPKLEQMGRLEEWLEIDLGIPPSVAQQEARRIVTRLNAETVLLLIDRWDRQAAALQAVDREKPVFALAPGAYTVPFQVYKCGGTELSMGDRGFRKPAVLICEGDESFFLMYPQQMQYQASDSSKCYTAKLDRLWYRSRESWFEAQEKTDGSRVIPATALRFENGQDSITGTVRIRLRSTISIRKMPESEADAVFDLTPLEPKHQCGANNLDEREHVS